MAAALHEADVVFGNLESACLCRCGAPMPPKVFSPIRRSAARRALSGIHAFGISNNVNYGAENIAASIERLDQLGMRHTGGGPNLAAARAPCRRPQQLARRRCATRLGLADR